MKEQIQKLAEESGIMHTSMSDAEWIKQGRLVEKFAELIVRECAAVANINSHQWQVPGDFVLEHFGVEQ